MAARATCRSLRGRTAGRAVEQVANTVGELVSGERLGEKTGLAAVEVELPRRVRCVPGDVETGRPAAARRIVRAWCRRGGGATGRLELRRVLRHRSLQLEDGLLEFERGGLRWVRVGVGAC